MLPTEERRAEGRIFRMDQRDSSDDSGSSHWLTSALPRCFSRRYVMVRTGIQPPDMAGPRPRYTSLVNEATQNRGQPIWRSVS